MSGTLIPCWRSSRRRSSHARGGGDHAALADAYHLARVERKAGESPCGRPMRSQSGRPQDLATSGASGILDDRQTIARHDRIRPDPRHAHLVHAEDRSRRRRDDRLDLPGSMLNVAGSISTNTGVAPQCRTVLAVAIRVADRDDSSPGPTPLTSSARCSAVVQFETAQGVGRADIGGEFLLESGHFRALSGPAARVGAARGLGLALVPSGSASGMKSFRAAASVTSSPWSARGGPRRGRPSRAVPVLPAGSASSGVLRVESPPGPRAGRTSPPHATVPSGHVPRPRSPGSVRLVAAAARPPDGEATT